MKSILLVGQSNMAGRGFLNEVPTILNDHLKMLRNGRWQLMTEPIHFDREVAGVGPAASFAQAWSADHPGEDLGVIPCAEGGSALAEWSPDGPLMRHAISEARFAQETSEIVAILWHQGESDSLNQQYVDYQDRLVTTLTHLRTSLALENVPLIMGTLPDFLGKSGFGQSATEYPQINREMTAAVPRLAPAYLVSGADLTANPDGIHINASSQRKFGLRYYQAFHDQQSVPGSLPDEDTRVAALYDHPTTVSERQYLLSKRLVTGQITFATFMAEFAAAQKD